MLAHAEAFLKKADGTNIDSILPRRYELILSMVSELLIDTETNKIYRSVYVALIAPCRWETVVIVFVLYGCMEIFTRKKMRKNNEENDALVYAIGVRLRVPICN